MFCGIFRCCDISGVEPHEPQGRGQSSCTNPLLLAHKVGFGFLRSVHATAPTDQPEAGSHESQWERANPFVLGVCAFAQTLAACTQSWLRFQRSDHATAPIGQLEARSHESQGRGPILSSWGCRWSPDHRNINEKSTQKGHLPSG